MLSPHTKSNGSSDESDSSDRCERDVKAEGDSDGSSTSDSEFSDENADVAQELDWTTSEDESQSIGESADFEEEKHKDHQIESEPVAAQKCETVSNGFSAFQDSILDSETLRPIDIVVLPNNPKSLKELGLKVIDPCAAGILHRLRTPSQRADWTPSKINSADNWRIHPAPANSTLGSVPSARSRGNQQSYTPKAQTTPRCDEPIPGPSRITPKAAESSKNNGSTAAPKKDTSAEQSKVVSNLRALLISSPCAISCAELNGDYKAMVGGEIPYKKLGFSSLELFLRSLNDVLDVEVVNKALFVQAKLAQDSSHISKLVTKQKKTSRKTKQRLRAASCAAKKSDTTRSRVPAATKKNGENQKNSWLYDNSGRGNWVAPSQNSQATVNHENLWRRESLVEKCLSNAKKTNESVETSNKCGNPACTSLKECENASREFVSCLDSIGQQFTKDLRGLSPKQLSYAASLITDVLDAARRNSLCASTSISGLLSRQPGGKIIIKPGPKASASSHLADVHKQRCCCSCPSE